MRHLFALMQAMVQSCASTAETAAGIITAGTAVIMTTIVGKAATIAVTGGMAVGVTAIVTRECG